MEKNHFHPVAGQIYQNHNGIKYLCLESEGFSNDGLFISVSSGYVLMAHGCKQNDDGTIEWNCSEDKGFHDVRVSFRKMMMNRPHGQRSLRLSLREYALSWRAWCTMIRNKDVSMKILTQQLTTKFWNLRK